MEEKYQKQEQGHCRLKPEDRVHAAESIVDIISALVSSLSSSSNETDEQSNSIESSFNNVILHLQEVKDAIGAQNKLLSILQEKDELIKNLYNEIERLNSNSYENMKRRMVGSIVEIHKRLNDIAEWIHYKAPKYEEVVERVYFVKDFVENHLRERYDLEYFQPKEGEIFNLEDTRPVQAVETDEKNKHQTIKEVISGGYRDIRKNATFQDAEVIVWRYKKAENEP